MNKVFNILLFHSLSMAILKLSTLSLYAMCSGKSFYSVIHLRGKNILLNDNINLLFFFLFCFLFCFSKWTIIMSTGVIVVKVEKYLD